MVHTPSLSLSFVNTGREQTSGKLKLKQTKRERKRKGERERVNRMKRAGMVLSVGERESFGLDGFIAVVNLQRSRVFWLSRIYTW